MAQEGDITIYAGDNGGEIDCENGLFTMSGGLESAVYLALFGGNKKDDGGSDETHSWWGNLIETDSSKQYRSETQYLLNSCPPIPANLVRIKEAVERDLDFMTTNDIASEIEVEVGMPALNRVSIVIDIDGENVEYEENWRSEY